MKNISKEIDFFLTKEYLSSSLLPTQKLFEFEHTDGDNSFLARSVSRNISSGDFLSLGESEYSDLETNMSYGGFHTTTMDDSFLDSAMKELRSYCYQQGIIAQLIRFNPLDKSTLKWKKHLDFFELDRKTVNLDSVSYTHLTLPTIYSV